MGVDVAAAGAEVVAGFDSAAFGASVEAAGLAASGFLSASLLMVPASTFCRVSGVTAGFALSDGFDDFAGSVFGASAVFGVSGGLLVTGSALALAAFGVAVSGLAAAGVCAPSDGFCAAAGLVVDFADVLDFAADDARDVDVCVGFSLPPPGVFAFATLNTLPILAAYKPFF